MECSTRLKDKVCKTVNEAASTQVAAPCSAPERVTMFPTLPLTALRLIAARRARKYPPSSVSPVPPVFSSPVQPNTPLAPAAHPSALAPNLTPVSNNRVTTFPGLLLMASNVAPPEPDNSPYDVKVQPELIALVLTYQNPVSRHPRGTSQPLIPTPVPIETSQYQRPNHSTSADAGPQSLIIGTSYQSLLTTNPALVTANGLKPLDECVLTGPPINNPYLPTTLPDYTLTSINLYHLRTRGSDSEI
jgi:hypothetical protein